MKSKRKHLMGFALLLLTGCAAYQMEPLSANHPAYPDTAAAPERPVSKTLAYTREDIPSTQPVWRLDSAARGRDAQQSAQGERRLW